MLMQPVVAFSAGGLIVLLQPGQPRRRPAPEGMARQRVASRSPEGRAGEGGELGGGGEQHQHRLEARARRGETADLHGVVFRCLFNSFDRPKHLAGVGRGTR